LKLPRQLIDLTLDLLKAIVAELATAFPGATAMFIAAGLPIALALAAGLFILPVTL